MMIRLLLLVLMITPAQAAVYQWVDEDGKKHFSDTPPPDKHQAKDISDTLKPANIDQGQAEQQKLKKLFTKPGKAEQQYEHNKNNGNKARQQQAYCDYLRNRLRTISGRVMFVDKQGKDVKVSEAERKQRVKSLEKKIKRECN
ncbi:MAG: hypothetical protein AseanaTS_02650 [Candidatus Pelagadaptatus aseana]|uniref:DUF4124 domain-containing protein n=1 Tax=Candidatus Pelagadaptatus aseana TaxID=3120508 RepID=UPI0039B34FA9